MYCVKRRQFYNFTEPNMAMLSLLDVILTEPLLILLNCILYFNFGM